MKLISLASHISHQAIRPMDSAYRLTKHTSLPRLLITFPSTQFVFRIPASPSSRKLLHKRLRHGRSRTSDASLPTQPWIPQLTRFRSFAAQLLVLAHGNAWIGFRLSLPPRLTRSIFLQPQWINESPVSVCSGCSGSWPCNRFVFSLSRQHPWYSWRCDLHED
jgi:hypothetical protein